RLCAFKRTYGRAASGTGSAQVLSRFVGTATVRRRRLDQKGRPGGRSLALRIFKLGPSVVNHSRCLDIRLTRPRIVSPRPRRWTGPRLDTGRRNPDREPNLRLSGRAARRGARADGLPACAQTAGRRFGPTDRDARPGRRRPRGEGQEGRPTGGGNLAARRKSE